MFNKFFNFLKGYVIIEAAGSDTERFLNICIRRGIDVSDVTRESDGTVTLRVSCGGFMKIRAAARKTKTAVRIKRRAGAGVIKRRYGGRYAFIIGAVLTIIFFAVTAQFVWVVKIDGVYEGSCEQIIEILEENGVHPGALKRNIPEPSAIKQALISRTDTIAWAWVYIEGACARVEIYEKRLKPQEVDKSRPCNVVAACDAFVERIDVRKGEDAVRNESVVSAGDVLISGKVPVFKEGYEERYMYVHAEGDIRAVTYHKRERAQKLYHESRIKTGRKKSYVSLELFGKLFRLYREENHGFENADLKESRHELTLPYFGYSGICLNERRYDEVEIYREPISEEAAALMAQRELEEEIAKELFKNPQLTDRELEWERIDGETITVKLKMTFIEDIGTEAAINEE